MKIRWTKTNDDQQYPNDVNALIDKIAIVFEEMNQNWREQDENEVAELKNKIKKWKVLC